MNVTIERFAPSASALAPLVRAALSRSLELAGVDVAVTAASIQPFSARPDAARFDARRRTALIDALGRGRSEFARQVLAKLREPNASVVITGQQPGVFVSPLYSLYKALTTARLAAELERKWGTPVVALFWNHADDHDVAEVHHTFVQNVNLDLQKVALAGVSSGRQPFSRIVLDEERHRLRAMSEACTASLPHARELEAALELLAPRAGETLSGAFTRGLSALVERFGVVVFEPDSLRGELSAALARLVASEPLDSLLAGAEALRRAGFEPAIDPREAALLFQVDERGRRALRATEHGWRLDGDENPITTRDLALGIEREPTNYSAGALLRPLVQDLALPAVAYVGGWGELAYHAELGVLRERAALPKTSFVPRASCTLLDAATREALTKLGTTAAEVLADPRVLEREDTAPEPPVIGRMRELARAVERDINALRTELEPLDAGLAQSLKRTAHQARSLVDAAREKAERVHQNASGRGRRNVRRVANTLLPRGEPQERVLGPLDFVARFGTAWIAAVHDAIDPFDSRSLIVELGEPPSEKPQP
ncbi:MAG: bacillithiol biosynthesis cysteine-adding enzyme BshC [Planctomycetes bacterium]|nr:bacillithiol biosynthesis cysteine-adding enzyme BshC [Planctomycetota bacterium]